MTVKCKAVSLNEWVLKAPARGEIGRIVRTARGEFFPVMVDGTTMERFPSLRRACAAVGELWWKREAHYAVMLRQAGAGSAEDPTLSIVCPRCGMRSYHPRDITERFCSECNLFHSE